MKIGNKSHAIYINIQDRKKGRFKLLTVYGMGHREVVTLVKNELEKQHGSKRTRH